MHGGSSKFGGRGGGRGGGRLSSFPPPPPPHRSSAPNKNPRLSLGGGGGGSNPRNRNSGGPSGATSAAPAVEETFSLVPGKNPLAFAMIIRLAPDLVDEIRKVEAQGGSARMKFDSMGGNNFGNVIDVGGKEFRFTWSKEFGDYCEIYEEHQSGEDGNGVLVESGSAWRKVNVQRILDESTTNHVKKLSEEAERKNKSRKAIVLDQGNPSMKNQLKQLALAESNPWRMPFKRKETPYKKQKFEAPPVSKSTFKPGVSSTASGKGRHSSSPLPSTPQRSAAPASPFGMGMTNKNNVSTEEMTPIQMKSKENVTSLVKEIQSKASSAVQETPGHKGNLGTKSGNLQSMLIALLTENPKGMTMKELEKAIGDKIPNSIRRIEPVIRKIAIYQAPGRYVLKSGMDSEAFQKPSSESGSSPEDNHQQTLVPEDKHDSRPALESKIDKKSPAVRFEECAQISSKTEEELNAMERSDTHHHSPDYFGEKKISDNCQEKAGSSSESGSDSDSESDSSDSGSDSGSCSRSRSRSRSPVGSGSESSSDSESDLSSNSKEGSDEDVDILSDDDKGPRVKLQASEPGFSAASQDQWTSGQNDTGDKQDGDGSDAVDIDGPGSAGLDVGGHESDGVDIEKDSDDDEKEVKLAGDDSLLPNKGEKHVEGARSILSDYDAIQERQNFIGTLFEDNEDMVTESLKHENSDSSERIRESKSKRGPDGKRFNEKSDRVKRLKVDSATRLPISDGRDSRLSESPHNRNIIDAFKGPATLVTNRADKEGNADFSSRKAYNQSFNGKPGSDFQQPRQRSSDKNARQKASDSIGRSKHNVKSGNGRKFSEKGSHVHEDVTIEREKASRDTSNEDNHVKEEKMPRNSKEGGAGGRYSTSFDSQYRKQGEALGKFKDPAQVTNSHIGPSPKDGNEVDAEKYPATSGRSLQRELSELELGEFRGSLPEEKPGKKQFDRKGSFKQSDNKPSTSDNCNLGSTKAKSAGKATSDSGKPSPSNLGTGVKRTSNHHTEDMTRSHHKNAQSHLQYLSRVGNDEVGSHFSKLGDTNSRLLRQNEAGEKVRNSMEGYGENHKRGPNNSQPQLDSKHGLLSNTMKEGRKQTSTTMPDLVDGRKDITLTEVNNNTQKRRESSLEEDDLYSKYEKDAPELKGPIKDFSQYKEYVQEFCDKYDSYCSLNKILETYRHDFHKLGKDLEFAKGRDMDRYHKILVQLKESYRQSGARHKRLKKIFVVLHEEIKNLKQRIKDYALSYTKD